MVLNGNEQNPISGYRAVLKLDKGKLSYTIYRNDTVIAARTDKPLATTTDYSFRFRHQGEHLVLEQDGEPVLKADIGQALPGQRPSYRASGCFALAHDAMVLGHNLLTYSFSDEPVDWISDGTWTQSVRWACDPKWSFLGGWSRGDATLWYKKRITGDQYIDAFLAYAWNIRASGRSIDDRYRDLGVAICADGHDPRSGYAAVYLAQAGQETYAATDGRVRPKRRYVLLRNGVEVAAKYVPDPPNKDYRASRLV